jgi:hypothetical protein
LEGCHSTIRRREILKLSFKTNALSGPPLKRHQLLQVLVSPRSVKSHILLLKKKKKKNNNNNNNKSRGGARRRLLILLQEQQNNQI